LTDSAPAGRYPFRVEALSTRGGLSERAAALDPPASFTFQVVYDANVDFVWKTLCRLGVRGSAVEDAVQEVFVVVHRKLSTFEGRSSMRTWLFQIARRVAHDRRRTVRRKEHPQRPDESAPDLDAIAADESASPDASASKADAVRVLYALLDTLDLGKREVFILAELEQVAAPQIAEMLGINVNTVYSRLRLAREAFNLALVRHHVRDGKTR
jgi:RNA polymerase sigma-70 factor, ECF subfamily